MDSNDYMKLFYKIIKYTHFLSLFITVILIGVFFKDMYYESLRPKTDEKTQKAIGNLGITIMSFLGIWFFSGAAYIFLYFFYYIDRKNDAEVIAYNLKIAQGNESVNKLVNNIDTATKMVQAIPAKTLKNE